MLSAFDLSLPDELERALERETELFSSSGMVERIWSRDASVWTGNGEDRWLGWLDIAERELNEIEKYSAIKDDAREFLDIVLLGMGGSSLCPDVLSKVFNIERFHVLDSTVPDQILRLRASIDPADTLFMVASKSGTTLEPNIFLDYFFDQVAAVKGSDKAGENFIAITDPGSKLEALAKRDGFRRVYFGDAEIGGRFSALSVFGMAPAAAMGLDLADLLENAESLVGACKRGSAVENPAAFLGCVLGAAQKCGRDKLEILASPSVSSIAAWLEQLVAESTGKIGKAIIPVDLRGTLGTPAGRSDRVLVYVRDSASAAAEHDEYVEALRAAHEPVITVDLSDKSEIGAEFFRWEFATAVAGSIMGINPFDQPDVESAKVEAKKLTERFEETGELPSDEPFLEKEGMRFFSNEENRVAIGAHSSASEIISAHLDRVRPGDYVGILAYVDMSEQNAGKLEAFRDLVSAKTGVSVSLQFGPRFLHSTGQAFKGGPDSGLFIQISAEDASDLDVPGRAFTFGVVKDAQARGDFQVLLDRGRRALRIKLGTTAADGLDRLVGMAG